MNNQGKLLLTLGAVAGAAALSISGSFATFSAQVTNPGSTFAQGTLVLSDTANGGSACLSTGSGTSTDSNINASCDACSASASGAGSARHVSSD